MHRKYYIYAEYEVTPHLNKNNIGFLWIIFFLLCFFPLQIHSVPPVNWEFKGINYASWWSGDYNYYTSEQSIEKMHTIGANWAALVTTWYVTNGTSSAVFYKAPESHPNSEVRKAIRDLHHMGFKVLLKPHMDRLDGGYRGF